MKQLKGGFLFLLMLTAGAASAQKAPVAEVTTLVHAFIQAGDDQDASALDGLLHAEYRVVMNQLFGGDDAVVLPRAAYLGKIKAKEFGGDTREVTVESVQLNGTHAVVRVLTKGQKLTMRSDLLWVQNAKGEWKLMSDTPTVL